MTLLAPGIHGIGCDIVRVARIAAVHERHKERFLGRAFHADEVADCEGRAERLAARWAAKEAVFKALRFSSWVSRPRFPDVVVVRREGRMPDVELRGATREEAAKLGVHRVWLSLSHEADAALAFAVAWRGADPESFAAVHEHLHRATLRGGGWVSPPR